MAEETKVEETKVITKEEAAKVLQSDAQQRARACGEEISAICKKHNCILMGVPNINAEGRIVAEVTVAAR